MDDPGRTIRMTNSFSGGGESNNRGGGDNDNTDKDNGGGFHCLTFLSSSKFLFPNDPAYLPVRNCCALHHCQEVVSALMPIISCPGFAVSAASYIFDGLCSHTVCPHHLETPKHQQSLV